MNYKLTVFGTNIYQEIEFPEAKKEILIGTTPLCQVRFNREHFFEDFEIRAVRQADAWSLECKPNVYFATEYLLKEYKVVLRHGESVLVNYDSTDSELFRAELLLNYDAEEKEFDHYIELPVSGQIMLGAGAGCHIRLKDPNIENRSVLIRKYDTFCEIQASDRFYGVYVNGYKSREVPATVRDGDFFALFGHQFFLKGNRLYVPNVSLIQTALPVRPVQTQGNALRYPRFKRNARQQYVIPEEEVEVLAPKELRQAPKRNLIVTLIPALTSLVLMVALRGVMGGGGLFVVYSAATMGIGAAMSVWTYMQDGKEYKEEVKKREEVYQDYISRQTAKIEQLQEKEQMLLRQKYLSVAEDMELVWRFDGRLFERDPADDDFLDVYLGTGVKESNCTVKYKKQEYKETEDVLADYPEMLHDKYAYIGGAPVTVNLAESAVLGVVGPREKLYQMLKNITLDLAIRQFYAEVRFYYILQEQDRKQMEWLRWLRNATDPKTDSRCFMYDEENEKFMLEFLYGELSRREAADAKRIPAMEHYVVFVYRSGALAVHPVAQYISRAKELGFTFIFFEEHPELLQYGCDRVVYLDGATQNATLVDCADGEKQQVFAWEHISTARAAACALRLGAVYVDEVNLESSLTKNITLYELLHIMNAGDLDLKRRWKTSRIYESMAAPLGVKSKDEVVCLDLHEKAHGPHGLVAGTTGSGKSEILQTYILSMATLFHPYEVGFVIIDFKGGGMVNQFRNLPHLNGAITNIDGKEIERSLLSIRAELRKRQELFAKYHVNHIDAYIRKFQEHEADQPLPHLILIVDEFAELKSSQPEFMKELISTARIGRSLGVHLILATQKPSGVVDDQIWSNSRFRLCLKVQNKEDSQEVLKSPLASEIKEPGRAYLQVGNNEIFQLFQSAYSGATASQDIVGGQKSYRLCTVSLSGKRQVIYEQKGKQKEGGRTQLEALVSYVQAYCEKNRIRRLPNICLPPLEKKIVMPADPEEATPDYRIAIGIYDDPNHQYQGKAYLPVGTENTLIIGAAQYGKTNFLETVIRGLASAYTPAEVNLYIIDFASMALKNFEKLAHVGGVVCPSDDEKLKNLFKFLTDQIAARREKLLAVGVSSFASYREAGYTEIPLIVVLIDNITALREIYLQDNDVLLNLCREGLSVGISFVIANAQTAGLGYKYMSNFAAKMTLFCNDAGEYANVHGFNRVRPDETPGRLILEIDKALLSCQTFLAFEGEREIERVRQMQDFVAGVNARYPSLRALPIPEIPALLDEAYIAEHFAGMAGDGRIVAGLDYATVMPKVMDLSRNNLLALSGAEGMGKSNFVRYYVHTLARGTDPVRIIIYDDFHKKLAPLAGGDERVRYEVGVKGYQEALAGLAAELKEAYDTLMAGGTPAKVRRILVLNNEDVVQAISSDKPSLAIFKDLAGRYRQLGVYLLLGRVPNAQILYGSPDIYRMVKDGRNILYFDELESCKLIDVPISIVRKNRKKPETGDAFYLCGADVFRIKTPLASRRGPAESIG